MHALLQTLGRRVLTVPGVVALFVLGLATSPLWVPVTVAVDVLERGRNSAFRCCAYLFWYLACELLGLVAAAAVLPLRLAGPRGWRRVNARLQNAWGRSLFLGARWAFDIRLETESAEVAARGPILLLLRHATLVDTLIPTLAVSIPYGLDLRYVLKSELLWDPCLDIVGNRMGHIFARRHSGDGGDELASITALAQGLGPGDGVLIYPEGTRFSTEKRDRILARLAGEGDPGRLEDAQSLRHVLPPRRGGTLALLEAAPNADVVVCAHTGLEAANRFRDLWRGEIRGATLRAHFWRIPRSEVPKGTADRAAWLQREWQRVDDWIDSARTAVEPVL